MMNVLNPTIKDRPGFTWPVFIYNDSLLSYTLKVFLCPNADLNEIYMLKLQQIMVLSVE
jgi:hypothetical protein